MEGDKIIETAVKAFGGVHVIINNAGNARTAVFRDMTEEDFRNVVDVHVYGAYKVTRAAWPIFRKQKFGRIINTTSVDGLYGLANMTNYTAAKVAVVGFSETLAKEGLKYNITSNVISPIHVSRMTKNMLPANLAGGLDPVYVVPLVAYLTHKTTKETYGIFECGAGFFSKVRWERSQGSLLKPDESNTPSAILRRWSNIHDFTDADHPSGPADFVSHVNAALKAHPNIQGEPVTFQDKVVIVTGAGAGIGRVYALFLAKQGAKVVVNDFVNPDNVVNEIRAAGGIAVGDKSNIVDGSHVVKTAVDAFGTVHAVVNNAGILRDKSFANITDEQWKQVMDVHLYGTFSVTKAAWPYFLKQKYGRIINTTSTSGIYGNFGQSNYAAAKAGIYGFSQGLAREGKKHNIFVNTIAPNAATAMTKSIFTEEQFAMCGPEPIAPLIALLASDKCPDTGKLFEVGSGWIGATRLQRSAGFTFDKAVITTEMIASNWATICDFSASTYPGSVPDAAAPIIKAATVPKVMGPLDYSSRGDYDYTWKDSILYNLAVGAKATELKHTFELSPDFEVLPTIGVIPYFNCHLPLNKMLPNFDPRMLLHGEQYLEIRKWPLPTSGHLTTHMRPLEILDKGKAAVVMAEMSTVDKETGDELFYNVATNFVRGSGNNGGPKKTSVRGVISAPNVPPARAPDFTAEFKISDEQAALYRLAGDFNPLHIDPEFAAVGNFPAPILHGLCSFGISSRLLYNHFGPFRNVKVRFSGHVFMGETIVVEAWKESPCRIVFQTRVKDRNTLAITAAAMELMPKDSKI